MELNQASQMQIYCNIDFYDRYKLICDLHQFENTFENVSKTEVLDILNQNGYTAKYLKNGGFFKINEMLNGIKFYFNFSLKYGLVELIIGATDFKTDRLIMGGTFGNISDDIEHSKNVSSNKKLFLPSFRNYGDLTIILNKALLIYEDFKKELLSLACE
ncbi:hypothetical protein ACFOG5_06315 [Pedobacter fastidiosus]|uniref:Uncharacterized protein n=1 Tax=Pedobacter fastidiosus TaxID=2765361 RepID=A0ABR7KV06_9SPHI|nr:hypothetical protein [Pedobacter fastidiosus]MBC6111945.1 hypothetical protein [Pedobacter fastidiosus]